MRIFLPDFGNILIFIVYSIYKLLYTYLDVESNGLTDAKGTNDKNRIDINQVLQGSVK